MPRGRQNRVRLDEKAGSRLLEMLAGGHGIVADKVIKCLARSDRQALGLACKALQDEVAARWRLLRFGDDGLPAEVLRSKLLPKLRGVEELEVLRLADGNEQSAGYFYRLLLALKGNGTRVKHITLFIEGRLLLPRRSARLAGQLPAEQQQHDWVLTADSLRQLEPAPHLVSLCILPFAPVDAALLQPLLRAPALQTAKLFGVNRMTSSILDLSACTQLHNLVLSVEGDRSRDVDLDAWLQGLKPAPCLKELDLNNFMVDSQQSLEYISSSLPTLEHIILQECQLAEPAGAGAGHELLQPSFPSLKKLELVYDEVTIPSEPAVQQLLLAATSLTHLKLGFPGPMIPHLPLDSPGLAQLEVLDIELGVGNNLVIFEGALLRRLAKYQRRLRKLKLHIWGECAPLQLHPQQANTQDVQAFLDAAPPGLELLQLLGFTHVQPSELVRPAAAAGCKLDTKGYLDDDDDDGGLSDEFESSWDDEYTDEEG